MKNRNFFVLGFVALGLLVGVLAKQAEDKAKRLRLPEGSVQISPCLPGMGEHWARPQDLPFGPIYGVMGEKVTFVEIMVSQADFAAGQSWTKVLRPLKGHAIDHVDIEFEPKGHEGYEIPHYDIHAYFVPYTEHTKYCP